MPGQRHAEVVHLNDIPAEKLFDFQRQVIFSPAARGEGFIKFAVVRGKKGAMSLPHTHPRDEVTLTLEGEAELRVGDQRYRLVPGTAVRIPPGTDHIVEVLSEEWVVVSAYCDECMLCVAGGGDGRAGTGA